MKTNAIFLRGVVLWAALEFVGSHLTAAEPIFDGLGSYSRKITTSSPDGQRYFDQGLAFYHGFNHGAAIRSFAEAARLDPKCAMAHRGIALAHGPHINNMVVSPADAEAEQVYREDLKRLPENGWSLYGLASSLEAQKKTSGEAAAFQAQFKKLWAQADTEITSSCFCQPKS